MSDPILKPEKPYTSKTDANANNSTVQKNAEASVPLEERSSGVLHTKLTEPVPERSNAESNTVLRGENNNWIIFGRDRISTPETGFGALGMPRAGAIELVVGIGGPRPDARNILDPSPTFDSAKIYISQKSNIDQHFEIQSNIRTNPASNEASAIAVKADAVRIIGRENIKIVTGTDAKNSNHKGIRGNPSITLIGNNDVRDIQPMVKGYNLQAMLYELQTEVGKLSGIVAHFLQMQHEVNLYVISHTHLSSFPNKPTSQSPSLEILKPNTNMMLSTLRTSLMSNVANLKRIESIYLARFDSNASPILSNYNFLN